MSQLRFTKVHGFERTQYLRWENGVRYPRQDNVIMLAKALGVSTHYLYTGREEFIDAIAVDRLAKLKAAINRAIIARKSLSDIQRIVADA